MVDTDGINNDGIAAVQIFQIPEPGSAVLLALGGAILFRRRRTARQARVIQ